MAQLATFGLTLDELRSSPPGCAPSPPPMCSAWRDNTSRRTGRTSSWLATGQGEGTDRTARPRHGESARGVEGSQIGQRPEAEVRGQSPALEASGLWPPDSGLIRDADDELCDIVRYFLGRYVTDAIEDGDIRGLVSPGLAPRRERESADRAHQSGSPTGSRRVELVGVSAVKSNSRTDCRIALTTSPRRRASILLEIAIRPMTAVAVDPPQDEGNHPAWRGRRMQPAKPPRQRHAAHRSEADRRQ